MEGFAAGAMLIFTTAITRQHGHVPELLSSAEQHQRKFRQNTMQTITELFNTLVLFLQQALSDFSLNPLSVDFCTTCSSF